MKHKNLSRLMRTISGILALTMTASIFSAVPASAYVEVGSSKTYYGDGYNVKYDVTSVWGDHSNVNVTLTNTGDEAIRNWALKYDTDGDIENIWNGCICRPQKVLPQISVKPCISRPHCHSCTDILPHFAADCPRAVPGKIRACLKPLTRQAPH